MAQFTHQQLDSILQRALELPEQARDAFLRETCGSNDELRRAVDRMLETCDADDALLEPGGAMAGQLWKELCSPRSAVELDSGERVGAYRIARTLGHGGMAAVYLAERDDGQFEQRVALKVMHPSRSVAEIGRRFEQERQILAALDHPHIARLVDGGRTASGQPFVAMECVEGEPVDAYCDREKLTVDQRLRLFMEVADAVQHAHRNLVIHRDIKPSNILVTAQGVTKLLDFGIAKLLDPSLPHAAPETRTFAHPMTPEYASPEQVRGEPLTTASDVYQLGYLLYQLVAGRRPYPVERRNYAAVLDAICHRDPVRPSQALMQPSDGDSDADPASIARARSSTPLRLQRQLRGDLDAVIMKSLRKEPEARYESAAALIDDLARYLSGQPVKARRGNAMYRAGKFIRRRRYSVSAAAAAVLLVLSLVGYYTQRLTVERDRAELSATQATVAAETAEQVTEFLLGLFEAGSPDELPGADMTARQLIDRGVARADDLGDQPEIQARMFHVMGRVHMQLAEFDKAAPLLERALAIRETALEADDEQIAVSMNALATLKQQLGSYDEAERLFRRALSIRRNTFGDRHEKVATSLNNLGLLLVLRGAYDEAEPLYRESLAITREVPEPDPAQLATKLNNLGALHYEKGEYESAEPLYREALDSYSSHYGSEHRLVAMAMENLANVYLMTDRLDAAERLMLRSLSMSRTILGDDHPEVAATHGSLANLYALKDELDQAEKHYRAALQIDRQRLGPDHPDMAYSLLGLGGLYLQRADAVRAEPLLRQGYEIRSRSHGAGDWRAAEAAGSLGRALQGLGRFEEAEPLLQASYMTLDTVFGGEHQRTRDALERIVAFYQSWNRPAEAARYAEQIRP